MLVRNEILLILNCKCFGEQCKCFGEQIELIIYF